MTVSVTHEIAFHDVDSMEIVWHGHYYKYFELARTALYRSCGLDVQEVKERGFSFPVIESHCRYAKPLHYSQKIQITAEFKRCEQYLLVEYKIQSQTSDTLFASGYTKQAACDADSNLFLRVPDEIIDAIFN